MDGITVRDFFTGRLEENGMFENEAKEVLELAIPKVEEMVPGYNITWDRPKNEYPEAIYTIMWNVIKEVALEWIEENAPEAWYKAMFQ